MHRRVPLWSVALVLLPLAGLAIAQGYQPNFLRNLVGPIFLTGGLTATGTVAADTVKAAVVDAGTLVATGPATVTGATALGSTLGVQGKSTFAGVNAGDVVLDGGARLVLNVATTHIASDTLGGVTGAWGAGANFTGNYSTSGNLTTDGTMNAKTALINSGTAAACSDNTGAVCSNDTGGSAFANGSGTTVAVITATGVIGLLSTDSTASPGAATINKASGRSAVPTNASTVTITNSTVAATSNVQITPLSDSTTDCAGYYVSTIGSGSFTLTCPPGFPMAAWKFAWVVYTAL